MAFNLFLEVILFSHRVGPAWGIELRSSGLSYKCFSLLGHLAMSSFLLAELGSAPALALCSHVEFGEAVPTC